MLERCVRYSWIAGAALALCCGPTTERRSETTGGEQEARYSLPDDAYADVRFGARGRDLHYHDGSLAEEPEASEETVQAPPTEEGAPGEVQVLIGARGDARELTEEELEREVLSGWEPDEEYDDDGGGGNQNRVNARPFHLIVNAPYESWAGAGSFVHLTVLDPGFRPATGAQVFLDGRLVGTTEAHGVLVFRRRPARSEDVDSGTLRVRWRGREREVSYDAGARTPSFEARTVYAYTDRGVYEPGQTIRVRALAWQLRGEYRAVPSVPLALELAAPDGRIVGGARMRTDDFGVAETALPLPRHAPEGQYTLAVATGEERMETRVIVQRFVAPAIEIRHDLGRFLTPATSTLTAEVRLGYFGGGDFHGGTLRMIAKIDDAELARAEREVEGEGPHHIELADELMAQVHRRANEALPVEVDLEVVDENGRTDVIRRFMRYAANPYRTVIELDRTRYAAGDPVVAMVRLVDLDNVPVRDRELTLDIPRGRPSGWRGTDAQLEAEDARDPEDLRRTLRQHTDDGGVARFRFPMPRLELDFDDATITARIDDVEDTLAEASLPEAAPLPMRSAVADTVVREGQDVTVEVAFPHAQPVERVVHADVVDSSGAIIHSALIPVRGRTARGVLRAPSWGSMLLALYCVGRQGNDVGLMSDGQNLVVHPGARLRVELGGLPGTARPGQTLESQVRVLGPNDRPRRAMLGVSVVDDAVLSLLDPLERAPFDRFYNPERKVLATTGAQTLTWPVVMRTWGQERYDIAWPETFGWHGGNRRRRRRPRRAAVGSMGNDPLAGLDGLDGAMSGGSGSGYAMGAGGLSEAANGAHADEASAETDAPPTQLILRTNFEETSLWLPRLEAEEGSASFRVTLPDSITEQRFTVVASDREGGIATAHRSVAVRQELYVRSDLPPAMTEGDRIRVGVAVRNLGAAARTVQVSLRSEDLNVEGDPSSLRVEPEGTSVAWFEVTAEHAGEARYTAALETTGLRDEEVRTLTVRPAGPAVAEEHTGVVPEGGAWTQRITLDASDREHFARLSIHMPSASVALDDLEQLIERGYFGPDPAASRVLAATAAYAYLARSGQLEDARRARYERWLTALCTAIVMAQRADGGWGWFWSGGVSVPLITAFALRALLELRDLGFPVPPAAIERAARSLFHSAGADHLYDVRAIAPWEGDDPRIRRQASADILDVLARTSLEDADLEPMFAALAGEVRRGEPDPLTLAHFVSALSRREMALISERDALLAQGIERLSRIRQVVHWEPGWFHAWGGTVEAAAVTLEVLAALDNDAYESARRDATRFLLHTRSSFGGWHNARSTAWAIRALTLTNPGVPNDAGDLSVHVDGELYREVHVDGTDQHAAALELRTLEIEGLAAGEHEIEVRYTGRMRPRVALRVERWPAEPAQTTTPVAGVLQLQREVPGSMRRGAPAIITLRTRGARAVGPLTIELPLPPGVAVERSALEALLAEHRILSEDQIGDTLHLGLPPGTDHELALAMVASRAGTLEWRAATLRRALLPGQPAVTTNARMTVE